MIKKKMDPWLKNKIHKMSLWFRMSFRKEKQRGEKWMLIYTITLVSSSQTVDLVFLYFTFYFYFIFDLFFYFLFIEQLGLGLIGHAVTSVTIWWHSHKTDHRTWENLVEDSRTNDIIQHRHYMLASWTIHGCLG